MAAKIGRVKHLVGESGVQVGDIQYIMDSSAVPAFGDRFYVNDVFVGVVVDLDTIAPNGELVASYIWVRPA